MSRAVQEGCIASCVRCSLLPDRTQDQGIMEEACSSRSLQDNKTNSPSQVVY